MNSNILQCINRNTYVFLYVYSQYARCSILPVLCGLFINFTNC